MAFNDKMHLAAGDQKANFTIQGRRNSWDTVIFFIKNLFLYFLWRKQKGFRKNRESQGLQIWQFLFNMYLSQLVSLEGKLDFQGNRDFGVILTDFECSKNNISSAGKLKAEQVSKFSS